jgi:hypothetical protein
VALEIIVSFLLLMTLGFGCPAKAEGSIFTAEIQSDLEITDSFALLIFDSGRLETIPVWTVPVNGEGDSSPRGVTARIVGGMLPEKISPQTPGAPVPPEHLTSLKVILRGASGLMTVVPVPAPTDEDLHSIEQSTREIETLTTSRMRHLEKIEGRAVQAEANLERARAEVEGITAGEVNKDGVVNLEEKQREVFHLERKVKWLTDRFQKLKAKIQYPYADLVQAMYEQASETFRSAHLSLAKQNKARLGKAGLPPDEKERLIELGRSVDPQPLRERLTLLRAKTEEFEDRLRAITPPDILMDDAELHPEEPSPDWRNTTDQESKSDMLNHSLGPIDE